MNKFHGSYRCKKKSQVQEKRIAKELGGKTQPGSGAFEHFKGDVKLSDYLIEAKRTDKQSITVKAEWLSKIDHEAINVGKIPALAIELGSMNGFTENEWIAIPMSEFKKLLERFGREGHE
jgi:hypothetical protein